MFYFSVRQSETTEKQLPAQRRFIRKTDWNAAGSQLADFRIGKSQENGFRPQTEGTELFARRSYPPVQIELRHQHSQGEKQQERIQRRNTDEKNRRELPFPKEIAGRFTESGCMYLTREIFIIIGPLRESHPGGMHAFMRQGFFRDGSFFQPAAVSLDTAVR